TTICSFASRKRLFVAPTCTSINGMSGHKKPFQYRWLSDTNTLAWLKQWAKAFVGSKKAIAFLAKAISLAVIAATAVLDVATFAATRLVLASIALVHSLNTW